MDTMRANDPAQDELLPCPFCGGKAARMTLKDEANFGGDVIACTSCDACSRVIFGEKEGLVDAWNRRAADLAHSELVDALEAIVRHYPNPDISHIDYRAHACRQAEHALANYRAALSAEGGQE
jgi:Lar family restriction alleviation protein